MIEDYKDKHKGERCFIIGNGPSLTKKDLTRLKGEITFGTNRIYLSDFIPTYYAIEDNLVMEDNFEDIDKLETVKFVTERIASHINRKAEIVNMKHKYHRDDFPQFSENLNDVVWSGGTVTYFCLQLAYWMGFDEVYLVGIDHDYKIPKDAIEVQPFVYMSKSDDPNHFNGDYFGAGKRFHDPQPERMEKSYKKAKEMFAKKGILIANASRKSKLTVFKKVRFDDLFTTLRN